VHIARGETMLLRWYLLAGTFAKTRERAEFY
jgi:hypothetical protein